METMRFFPQVTYIAKESDVFADFETKKNYFTISLALGER